MSANVPPPSTIVPMAVPPEAVIAFSGGAIVELASGGTATGITMASGGTLAVLSGGIARPVTIASGGLDIVSARGSDFGAQVSGGTQLVYGLASGATLMTGLQVIELGSIASRTLVSSGGTLDVLSGGTAVAPQLFAGVRSPQWVALRLRRQQRRDLAEHDFARADLEHSAGVDGEAVGGSASQHFKGAAALNDRAVCGAAKFDHLYAANDRCSAGEPEHILRFSAALKKFSTVPGFLISRKILAFPDSIPIWSPMHPLSAAE